MSGSPVLGKPVEDTAKGGDGTETPTQHHGPSISLGGKSPIKKPLDERKGPKNNKRKWGDASFVTAARAVELGKVHQGMPIYSDDMMASESPARQPLRLLSKCKFSVHADIVKAHPMLNLLPAHGLTLSVYQIYPAGPAAWLPSEVTMSRLEPVSILKTNSIVPIIRPLMCVVADGDDGGTNTAGLDVLEKFLAGHGGAEERIGMLVLRTLETQTCQFNQTSTFKREREEVIAMYSSTSKVGKEFLGDLDENMVFGPKHLRAAFVDTNGQQPQL